MENYWKKCSSCKTPIGFASLYYVCSVSTCQHVRKGYQFCSVACWDAHLGYENHKESWAIEKTSPSKTSQPAQTAHSANRPPQRRIIQESKTTGDSSPSPTQAKALDIKTDTLVVVSKVKKLIKDLSGFNTSQCGIDALTKKVVQECLKGIENAQKDERKTVMGRDI